MDKDTKIGTKLRDLKPYAPPRLQEFGGVRQLTAGGSKAFDEDFSMGSANPDPGFMTP